MEEYNFDKLYLASFYEIKIQEASQWTNTIKNEKALRTLILRNLKK